MPDPTPVSLQPILAHLLKYGELSSFEAHWLKMGAGLLLLESGKFVQVTPDFWLIGPNLERLFPASNLEEAWQKACFSLPAYRTYLTNLAAGEIARRGLEGASDLVEQWVATSLPHQAQSFNAFLDQIEQNDLHKPLIEITTGALIQAVQHSLHAQEKESEMDFASWNQELLGINTPAEAVFQTALARGALAKQPDDVEQDETILSPIQDLNSELTQNYGRWVLCPQLDHPNPLQHSNLAIDPAWQKRRYVFSSVPLMDDGDDGTNLPQEQVQAAFCQHPLSWIIIQLGLHIQIQKTSGASETLLLALERNPDGMPTDLRIEIPGANARSLSEALPALVSGLSMRLLLPFGEIQPAALGSWLEALVQAGILESRSDGVSIGQEFGRVAFESKFFQSLIKTPKPWRIRIVEILMGK